MQGTKKNLQQGETLKTEKRSFIPFPLPETKGQWTWLVAVSFFVSSAAVFGMAIDKTGYLQTKISVLTLRTVGMTLLCMVVVVTVEWLFLNIAQWKGGRVISWCEKLTPTWSKKSVLVFALVIIAFWGIYLIAFFPGSMNWDTFYQISQWYPESHPIRLVPLTGSEIYIPNYFCDHHPIFDTLVYGAFAVPSGNLFGTWNYGVFAFILIQAFGTALSFSVGIAYMRKIGAPTALVFLSLAFFCLMPFIPLYVTTMMKDSFFAWFFIPYTIMIIETVRTKGAVLKNRKFFIGLIVICCLLALTKKTGVFLVIGTAVILALVYRKYWKRLLVNAGVVAVLMYLVLPLVVFPLLDVAPGGKQEMLSPFLQQTNRYLYEHGDDVTPEEKAAIDAVVDSDALSKSYDPQLTDAAKLVFNHEASTGDIVNYMFTWAKQGLRHPACYFGATLATSASYFAPLDPINIYPDTADVEHDGGPLVWQPKAFEGLHDFIVGTYLDVPLWTPIVNFLFLGVLYFFWIPVFALYFFIRHGKSWVPVLIPLLFSIAFNVIAPVYDARYGLHMLDVAPFVICLIGVCAANPKALLKKAP